MNEVDPLSLPAVPMPISGVYFLIRHGVVVYVGQSNDVATRVKSHRREGKRYPGSRSAYDFDDARYIAVPVEQLDDFEIVMIAKFSPMYNRSTGGEGGLDEDAPMIQSDLFAWTPRVRPVPRPPAQPHSPTSRAAGRAIESSAATLRAAVLRLLREDGPATDEELQERLGMAGNTERPRRRELQQAGAIADSGARRVTRSGRYAVVWRAM